MLLSWMSLFFPFLSGFVVPAFDCLFCCSCCLFSFPCWRQEEAQQTATSVCGMSTQGISSTESIVDHRKASWARKRHEGWRMKDATGNRIRNEAWDKAGWNQGQGSEMELGTKIWEGQNSVKTYARENFMPARRRDNRPTDKLTIATTRVWIGTSFSVSSFVCWLPLSSLFCFPSFLLSFIFICLCVCIIVRRCARYCGLAMWTSWWARMDTPSIRHGWQRERAGERVGSRRRSRRTRSFSRTALPLSLAFSIILLFVCSACRSMSGGVPPWQK